MPSEPSRSSEPIRLRPRRSCPICKAPAKQKYHPFCRLVSVQQNLVCGWVALAPVSARDCYRGVAELSIYVTSS